jgi:transaldolase
MEDNMIKLYADGASIADMKSVEQQVQGFTTNPTLMRKAGVTNYEQFAKEAIAAFPDKPISFEVFTDDFDEMIEQAMIIDSWGPNVYVKIPIIDTHGNFAGGVIETLNTSGIKVNVTAILTKFQVMQAANALDEETPSILSIFTGRITDTGRAPFETLRYAQEAKMRCNVEILWASTREVYNIVEADDIGCDIITVTPDILKKWNTMRGKDLTELSLDTVKMFYDDAKAAGYTI